MLHSDTPHEISVKNDELFPFILSLLEQGHTATLRLRGFSMRPFLEDERDNALLCKVSEVVVGEPVLAEIAPGQYVLHRLVALNGEEVTLLGDGNITPEQCKRSDVKAQVVGFYRKGSEHLDRIDGRKWKAYSFVWMHLRPLRRYLLAFYRRWVRLFGPI